MMGARCDINNATQFDISMQSSANAILAECKHIYSLVSRELSICTRGIAREWICKWPRRNENCSVWNGMLLWKDAIESGRGFNATKMRFLL